MSEQIEGAQEVKRRAKHAREMGEHATAEAQLVRAIEELEPSLQERRAARADRADAEETALADELADLYGMLAGTLREAGRYEEAAAAYDAGYAYEADARYGLPSTYNALNRLTSRILVDAGAMTDSDALRRHEGLSFLDVPAELEALRTRLERDVAGPRADDPWAVGDLALVSALTGHADGVVAAVARLTRLDPPASAALAIRRVADGLAAQNTPRRSLLTELSRRLAALAQGVA